MMPLCDLGLSNGAYGPQCQRQCAYLRIRSRHGPRTGAERLAVDERALHDARALAEAAPLKNYENPKITWTWIGRRAAVDDLLLPTPPAGKCARY